MWGLNPNITFYNFMNSAEILLKKNAQNQFTPIVWGDTHLSLETQDVHPLKPQTHTSSLYYL